MTAPTTRETADHAELARLCEQANSASTIWHADKALTAIFAIASPDYLLALLSEIAALRGERDEAHQKYVDANEARIDAERQRDELRKALERQCDNMSFALNRLDFYSWHGKFEREVAEDRALLANQGADQ